MSRRFVSLAILAIVAAAVCVRLGVWQLSRLGERRARNALVASRLDSQPVPLAALPGDTALVRFRRVRVTGTYDFGHEMALANRTRNGSPGVYVLTPLRPAAGGPAVLVNRGWAYSPDGSRIDLSHWREPDTATVVGYVETFPAPRPGAATAPERPRILRRLDYDAVAGITGYPLAPYYVVQLEGASAGGTPDGGTRDSTPARLMPPPLDEGPHLSYAFQWFSFAAIAVGGMVAVWLTDRKKSRR